MGYKEEEKKSKRSITDALYRIIKIYKEKIQR